jgi:hypothetical protein
VSSNQVGSRGSAPGQEEGQDEGTAPDQEGQEEGTAPDQEEGTAPDVGEQDQGRKRRRTRQPALTDLFERDEQDDREFSDEFVETAAEEAAAEVAYDYEEITQGMLSFGYSPEEVYRATAPMRRE